MLRWRLASSTVIIGVLVGLLWLDLYRVPPLAVTGGWLIPLGVLVTALIATETLDLFRSADLHPHPAGVVGGAIAVYLASCVPVIWQLAGARYPPDCPLGILGWPLAAYALAVAALFVIELRRYRKPGNATINVALATLAVTHSGLLMSFLVALRLQHGHRWGMAALLSLIVVVKFSDCGAYAIGRTMGRHKLAPVLSPGKTVEGAVGGVLVGCLVSLFYFRFLVPWLVGEKVASASWIGSITFGLIVGVAGIVGDLSESLIKRDVARKDSSVWLPGLGGVLDTVDSVLMAAVPAYLCWVAGLVGPS